MNIVDAGKVGNEAAADAAAAVLLHGGVAILPPDTVYGIACHPDFPEALERIYRIKGRDYGKPIAFLASDADAPARLGARFSERTEALARSFWPGALTIVANCGGKSEGFRVPDCTLARLIIEKCGGLLRVTSANPSGQEAAKSASDPSVLAIADKCDIVIDGGECQGGVASTVVRDNPWAVLREGAIRLASDGVCISGVTAK